MKKTIISLVCVVIIVFFAILYENSFIKRQFLELHDVLSVLYEKIDDHVAIEDDVYAVQNNWLGKKRFLHAFIPHNEIKEVDLWIAESVTLVRDKNWEDAISKIEVLLELAEQIPKTFLLSWENIF